MAFEVVTIGPATLYRGDAREVLPTIADCGAVVTDPPYGILNVADGKTTAIRKSRRASGSGKLKDRMINTADYGWDSEPPDAETLAILRSIGAEQIIWGGNYLDLPPTRCVLAWDKMQPWENFSQFELAWTSLDRPAALFQFNKSMAGKEHPTQKPLPLMMWCLGFVPDAESVLDPYMGSGTTGVACINTDRTFIGVELEPRYFDIACRRIEAAWIAKRSEIKWPEPTPPKQLDLL